MPDSTNVKKLALLLIVGILIQISSRESIGQITGTIRDADQQIVSQVSIIVKGTGRGTVSDVWGKYSIQAEAGDILQFSHVAMQFIEILVEESPSVINVSMQLFDFELAEVQIKARGKSTYKNQKQLLVEYPENKSLIKTSRGILDKDLSSTAMRIIDGKDLGPGGRDFLSSLQTHVPSLVVDRGDQYSPGVKVYLRQYTGNTGSPNTALFDVNGFITLAPPTYLTAADIDRIAILERNAAMSRYGPQGTGGVIVINTRAQTEMDDRGVIRFYDNRALADSLKRVVNYLEPYQTDDPYYMGELKEAKSRKKALAVYEKQKEYHLDNPYYLLDVYDYFLSRWKNKELPEDFYQDLRNHMPDDVHVLKALAYFQQQYGNFEAASELYLQVLLLQTWDAQALRDVANGFFEAGDIKKAWMYYSQYIDIQNQLPEMHFDANGKDLFITTEMMDILALNNDRFLANVYMENILDDDMRTRLVFEWNVDGADFELQFVSPEGYYDTWVHSAEGDDLVDPQAAKGYACKQFFLGKENIGTWQVNIDYKGKQTEVPIYLKVSVYHNFGLPDQRCEVKVFKLREELKKGQLFTIQQG